MSASRTSRLTLLGVLALILALGECIPAPNSGDAGCSGGAAFYADPNDCSIFYQCAFGRGVQKNCPSGLHWNAKANTCAWPEEAGCTAGRAGGDDDDGEDSGDSSKSSGDDSTSEESVPGSDSSSSESNSCPEDKNPPKCPAKDPALSVFFSHPDPHWFYHCSNGVAYCKVCPADLVWNEKCDTCDWPDKNGCPAESNSGDSSKSSGDESTSEESVPGSDSSSESEPAPPPPTKPPTSPSEPQSSESGDSSKSSGDDSTSEESVPGSDSSSSESNSCPEDKNPPKCPAQDPALSVFFQHPDPHWFYHCSNGVAYCKVCPADLVWNEKCDTCDWPDKNGCPAESNSGDSSKSSGDESTSEESVPGSDSSSESEPAPPPPTQPPTSPPEPQSSESGDSSKSSGDDSTSEESVPGSDSSSSESNSCPEDKNPPKCPAQDPALSVFFPHPDPHWFYHCSNGVAYCKVCPADLVWNTKCDTCDWPDLNGCPAGDSGDSSKSSGDASTSEESVPGSDSSSES